MNRQQYKARIKELEDLLTAKDKELKQMMELWAQVVAHKKSDDQPKRMKVFGGYAEGAK